MQAPRPTPVFRLVHIDNLPVFLRRGGLHAPNFAPKDGLRYRTIHNAEIQGTRRIRIVPSGPGGVVHDYVPFHSGYLSPMLLQLKTGRVPGYSEGQDLLVYLVSTAQDIAASGARFVFSDGHGIAAFTSWYDDLGDLDKVDWDMIYQQYWADTMEDPDRQRRKQAEFLVHRSCDWTLIREIGVLDASVKRRVEAILRQPGGAHHPVVNVQRNWYY